MNNAILSVILVSMWWTGSLAEISNAEKVDFSQVSARFVTHFVKFFVCFSFSSACNAKHPEPNVSIHNGTGQYFEIFSISINIETFLAKIHSGWIPGRFFDLDFVSL